MPRTVNAWPRTYSVANLVTVRPTLPLFSVAPMTATTLGENIGSSG